MISMQGLDCETSEDPPEEVAYVVIYLSVSAHQSLDFINSG